LNANPSFANYYVDNLIAQSIRNEILPNIMIETMNEFRQNQAAAMRRPSEDNYRLASDRYLSEAVGFDSLPYTVPFDPERFILVFFSNKESLKSITC
jgi:hypothetical protein